MSPPPASDSYAAWRDRLTEANDPAFWPIEAIDRGLLEGAFQFWANSEAALVTRVVAYPGGARVLEAIAGSGKAEGLIEQIEPVAASQAKETGLTHLQVIGRPGWARKKPKGWKWTQVVIEKELNDG